MRSQSSGTGVGTNTEQTRLSPISANSTRYEQPPLYPFRSLRETANQRLEMSQTNSATSSDQNGLEQEQLQQQQPGLAEVEVQSTSTQQALEQTNSRSGNVDRSTNTDLANVLESVVNCRVSNVDAAAAAAADAGDDDRYRELRLLGNYR